MKIHTYLQRLALCVPLALASDTASAQQSTYPPYWFPGSTVYFYNGCHNDTFNLGSQGWLLNQLSMLGASGLLNPTSSAPAPAPSFGAGVTYQSVAAGDGHATSPGSVLNNADGDRIGYANANLTHFAFDLDKVNLNEMLAVLPNAAEIVISKHGLRGGTTLDGGEGFPGFTGEPYPGWGPPPGTGGPPTPPTPTPSPGTPYPLPDNQPYHVYLNTCFSEDPAPDGGPSPCGTARAIPGVTASGNNGMIYKGPKVNIIGGSGNAQVAQDAIAAGHSVDVQGPNGEAQVAPNLSSFYGSMSFDQFGAYIRNLAATTGSEIRVSWYKGPLASGGAGVMNANDYLDLWNNPIHYYEPPQVIGSRGGSIRFGFLPQDRPILLEVPAGALKDDGQAIFIDFRPHVDLLPAGYRASTRFVHVDDYQLQRDLRFEREATLTLRLDVARPKALWVARIDEETGSAALIDYELAEDGRTLSMQIEGEGTYVAIVQDDGSVVESALAFLAKLDLL